MTDQFFVIHKNKFALFKIKTHIENVMLIKSECVDHTCRSVVYCKTIDLYSHSLDHVDLHSYSNCTRIQLGTMTY